MASLTWSGERLEAQAIESALSRLREAAAGVSPEGERPFVTRTSVLTLVAYAPDGDAAQRAAQVIASLSQEHPSRSIVLRAGEATARASIEAHLSAHCHLTGPQRQGDARWVCCEEIALTVRGPAAGHLHSVVLPLLVSDIPVVFWWVGDWPADTHTLDDLMEVADRFLVDSACFTAADALSRLARLCGGHPSCGVGDFNWARLNPWRDLVAQFFDAPALPHLAAIREVEVDYAATERQNPAQALLLTAWLASRLGWQRGTALGDAEWRLQGPQGEVAVRLAGRPAPQVAEGGLLSLRLKTGDATFSIRRSDDGQAAVTVVDSPEVKQEGRERLEAYGEAEMLSAQLRLAVRDQVFEEALAFAASLVGR